MPRQESSMFNFALCLYDNVRIPLIKSFLSCSRYLRNCRVQKGGAVEILGGDQGEIWEAEEEGFRRGPEGAGGEPQHRPGGLRRRSPAPTRRLRPRLHRTRRRRNP